MNENERNVQNFSNMQPVNPNVGMPVGPNPSMPVQPQMAQAPQMTPVGAAPSQAMTPSMVASPELVNQPIPMNSFMDNFADAVIQKPEPMTMVQPMPQAPTVPSASAISSMEQPAPQVIQPEPVVQSTQEVVISEPTPVVEEQPVSQVAEAPQAVPLDPNTVAQMEAEVASEPVQAPTSRKKESHWKFILILFAIVGVSVLLFPLAVRIFGY